MRPYAVDAALECWALAAYVVDIAALSHVDGRWQRRWWRRRKIHQSRWHLIFHRYRLGMGDLAPLARGLWFGLWSCLVLGQLL